GGDAEDDEVFDPPLLFGRQIVVGVEGVGAGGRAAAVTVRARHFSADLAGEVACVEFFNSPGARFARKEATPRRLDIRGERRDHAKPGDNDAPHVAETPSPDLSFSRNA